MILTDENRKFIADAIDVAIKSKNIIVEALDGPAANIILKLVDSFVESKVKISEEIKTDLNGLVEAVRNKDYDATEILSAKILDTLIDVPGLDDATEALLFEGAMKLIIGALQNWLQKAA